jgi:hypothetical protein
MVWFRRLFEQNHFSQDFLLEYDLNSKRKKNNRF